MKEDEPEQVGNPVVKNVISESQTTDWLLEEISHHALFAQQKRENFHGRTKLIGRLCSTLFDVCFFSDLNYS